VTSADILLGFNYTVSMNMLSKVGGIILSTNIPGTKKAEHLE
jgi:ribosomal protein L30E